MTLSFSKTWPEQMGELAGAPTNFQERIIEGLLWDRTLGIKRGEWARYLVNTDVSDYEIGSLPPKLHSVRVDENTRWKAGVKIHFVTGNRTPQRFQFAPIVPCVSTQAFKTVHSPLHPDTPYLFIGNSNVGDKVIEQIAKNDGFDSVEAFFRWFGNDYNGKLIHWTSLKY